MIDGDHYEFVDYDDDDDECVCPRCQGDGKVPTMDFECYLGAMYKPCPLCHGDDCFGEPRLS